MKKLFNGVALAVGVTCLVWVAVLWQWQRTHRDMSMDDIVVYLVLLPLVVLALVLMARWAWRSVQARHAAQTAARQAAAAAAVSAGGGATASSPGNAAAASPADAAQRHLAWPVWAVAVNSPAGASADELLGAAEALAPRPALDEQLRDDDGAPLLCARVPDLDLDALKQAWQGPGPEVDDAVLRAAAALPAVLADIARGLRDFLPDDPDEPSAERPDLKVLLGVPAAWSLQDRDRVKALCLHHLQDACPAWPRDRMRIGVVVDGGEALWRAADDLLTQADTAREPVLVLVAAAHSDLSASTVDALEAAGRLFHASRRPKGHMPGEAAAAVLLSTTGCKPPADPTPGVSPVQPLAWVHRPALGQRDKPVDAGGKVASDLLSTLIEHACTAARTTPDQVAALVCDADQHSARGTELFGATLSLLPQLDVATDVRLTGVVCAGAGVATPVLVLAAACAHAHAIEHLVLAVCVGDPTRRLVLLARPALPEPPASAAPAPAAGAATS